MSKILEAAMRTDLAGTLWRLSIHQDNTELLDLLPDQIADLMAKYPRESAQYLQLKSLYESKTNGK
jgi:hypothetical protein